MSRRGLWRPCPSNVTCCGACWMLLTGPIRAASDRGIINYTHWTILYQASDLPVNFRLYCANFRACATPGRRGEHNGTGGGMSIAVLSTNRPHLARQVRLEWDPVRNRQVLLAPEGVLVLNQTGATILGLCDGERTVVEIVEELRGQYNRVVGDEVRDFLARLVAKRWVELGDE